MTVKPDSTSVLSDTSGRLSREIGQGFRHILIGELAEVQIEVANRAKSIESVEADDFIDFTAQIINGFSGGHWHGEHEFFGLAHTNRPQGRPGCCFRSYSIIDYYYYPAARIKRRAIPKEEFTPPFDLGELSFAYGLKLRLARAGQTNDVRVADDGRANTVNNRPKANSGCIGAPIFRTRIISNGAPSALATSAATGTAPRGGAKMMGY